MSGPHQDGSRLNQRSPPVGFWEEELWWEDMREKFGDYWFGSQINPLIALCPNQFNHWRCSQTREFCIYEIIKIYFLSNWPISLKKNISPLFLDVFYLNGINLPLIDWLKLCTFIIFFMFCNVGSLPLWLNYVVWCAAVVDMGSKDECFSFYPFFREKISKVWLSKSAGTKRGEQRHAGGPARSDHVGVGRICGKKALIGEHQVIGLRRNLLRSNQTLMN